MAEKGFGVKEINLIGASGTPTIESPNNLNLNAVNVAISTNVSIGGTLSVTGNVSVGGTLTYEDVTNIDSVGLITARSGVVVGAGKSILVGAGVTISSSTKGDIQISGIATAQRFDAPYTGAGSGFSMEGGAYNNGFYINNNSGNTLLGMAYFSNNTIGLSGNGSSPLSFIIDDVASISLNPSSGACALNYAGSGKLQTTNTGITVTGTASATTFSGSGASLTTLNATQLTSGTIPDARFPSTLPAVSGANLTNIAAPVEAPVVNYTVTSNGSSAYRISGGGVDSSADDPDLYLIRGQKYRFNNTTGSSHPFQFRLTTGGSAYTDGITGDQNGVQFFTPALDAPSKLYYICTLHSGMVGTIYLRGAGGNNENVGITTFSGAVRLTGNPTFWAYRTSFYNLTSSATEMVYDSEKIDIGGNYNPSNGRFTAPVDGLYEFGYASIGHNTATVYRYELRVNGADPYSGMSLELRIDQAQSGSEYGTNGEFCCYVNMTAGQTASVYASSDSSASCYGSGSYGYTYFRGRLIG